MFFPFAKENDQLPLITVDDSSEGLQAISPAEREKCTSIGREKNPNEN